MQHYHFTGCAAYVDRAAETLGLTDARLRARARTLDPVGRVQTALGQATHAKSGHQAAILAEAEAWRLILAVAHRAVDEAIADTRRGLGLDSATPAAGPSAPSPPPDEDSESSSEPASDANPGSSPSPSRTPRRSR